MIPLDGDNNGRSRDGFQRAHGCRWVELWEVVWPTFQLRSACLELKKDSYGGQRSGRGSSVVYEEACSSWVMWTSIGAV